jgi:hypothetical protein
MSKKPPSKRLDTLFDELAIPASDPTVKEQGERPPAPLGIPLENPPLNVTEPLPTPAQPKVETPSCPHLGLVNDPDTSLTYPAEWNFCHRASPPYPPNYDHQSFYCLASIYQQCPFFKKKPNTPLPDYIRMEMEKPPVSRVLYRKG